MPYQDCPSGEAFQRRSGRRESVDKILRRLLGGVPGRVRVEFGGFHIHDFSYNYLRIHYCYILVYQVSLAGLCWSNPTYRIFQYHAGCYREAEGFTAKVRLIFAGSVLVSGREQRPLLPEPRVSMPEQSLSILSHSVSTLSTARVSLRTITRNRFWPPVCPAAVSLPRFARESVPAPFLLELIFGTLSSSPLWRFCIAIDSHGGARIVR